MFSKQKVFIFVFLIGLLVSIFPMNSAYADSRRDCILDIYGNPVTTDKQYILVHKYLFQTGIHPRDRIAPVGHNKLGITYERYRRSYYPIQYLNSSYYGDEKRMSYADFGRRVNGKEYFGTPFWIAVVAGGYRDPRNNKMCIKDNTSIKLSMYIKDRMEYLNVGNRSWSYFHDTSASTVTVKKRNSQEVDFATGSTDYLRDKFGRPSDWWNADPKQSSYGVSTTFQVQPTGYVGSDSNKWWGYSGPKDVAGYEFVPIPLIR